MILITCVVGGGFLFALGYCFGYEKAHTGMWAVHVELMEKYQKLKEPQNDR